MPLQVSPNIPILCYFMPENSKKLAIKICTSCNIFPTCKKVKVKYICILRMKITFIKLLKVKMISI